MNYVGQEVRKGRTHSLADLIDMAAESATLRVRPLVTAVGMNIVGLIPVLVDTGVESDVAKRVAAPLWSGLISLTILTLAVIPSFYVIWRWFQLRRALPGGRLQWTKRPSRKAPLPRLDLGPRCL